LRVLLLGMLLLVAVVTCLAPSPAAAAGKYEGSVPLLCAPVVVTECGPEGDCRRRTAQSVNLPEFFKVDLMALKVRSDETDRDSPIKNVERSAAVSTEGEGFIVFGGCTLP
jgi:hypothetical protein